MGSELMEKFSETGNIVWLSTLSYGGGNFQTMELGAGQGQVIVYLLSYICFRRIEAGLVRYLHNTLSLDSLLFDLYTHTHTRHTRHTRFPPRS